MRKMTKALLGATAALPLALAAQMPMDARAACGPCKAVKGCKASNAKKAAGKCNPCAAKKASTKGTAKKGCGPCNPCAAKK
jgi:hypothetical protein